MIQLALIIVLQHVVWPCYGWSVCPLSRVTLSTVCVGKTVTWDVVPTICTLLPPSLMRQSASVKVIGTLGSGLAGIGGLPTTLGSGTARQALGWVWRLFCCSFAFAIADFAVAILVNSLLNFLSASAISPLPETNPFNALLVRSNAAFMTSVLGVTCRFVIYWCLKNTALLTRLALVFTM